MPNWNNSDQIPQPDDQLHPRHRFNRLLPLLVSPMYQSIDLPRLQSRLHSSGLTPDHLLQQKNPALLMWLIHLCITFRQHLLQQLDLRGRHSQ